LDKIYKLIYRFSKKERKELHTFLISPFYNKNKSIVTLYKLVLKNSELNKFEDLDSLKIYKKIFKTDEYKSSTMRNLISDLTNLILKYSALKYIENSGSGYYEDSYIKSIKLRKLSSEYYYKFNEWKKDYKQRDSIIEVDYEKEGIAFYNNKLDLDIISEGESKKFDIGQRIFDLEKLSVKSGIFDFLYSIKCFMVLNVIIIKNSSTDKLYSTEILNRKDILYQKIINLYNYLKESNEDVGYLDIYKFLIELSEQLMKSKFIKLEDFIKLDELILKNESKFGIEEINFLFIQRIQLLYSTEYSSEKNLIKFKLLKNYFLKGHFKVRDNYDIDASLFRLTLLSSFDVKDFDFAKIFIDRFSKYITESQRNSMTNLAYSFYYNRIGDFNKSLEYLNKTELKKQIFEYDARILLIRNFYELNFIDSALEQVNNFKIYLSKAGKKKGLTITEQAHLTFLNYFEKYIKDSEKKNFTSIGISFKKLKSEKNIILSTWLSKIMSEKLEQENKKSRIFQQKARVILSKAK